MCPSRITSDVILSGDEQLKPIEGDTFSLRELIWNNGAREFHKYTGKLDKDFFGTYKKVYDIEVVIKESFKNTVWNKDTKQEEEVEFFEGTSATLNAFSAGRLRNLIESLDLDEGLVLIDGKDKLGEPTLVKPYDWEDLYKAKLEGKFVSMRVRGTGLDTKYSFKEVSAFPITETVPVAPTVNTPKVNTPANSKYVPLDDEITVSDIPF